MTAYLPPDTLAHGFDNIADEQGISSAVMEGYLRAASVISRLAVGERDASNGSVTYKIPRDASQQVSAGRMVGHLPDYSDILPGDLLFFMDERAKVYHVGLSLGRSKFIHASFVKKGVIYDDLRTMDPERQKKYYSKFLFAKSVLM